MTVSAMTPLSRFVRQQTSYNASPSVSAVSCVAMPIGGANLIYGFVIKTGAASRVCPHRFYRESRLRAYRELCAERHDRPWASAASGFADLGSVRNWSVFAVFRTTPEIIPDIERPPSLTAPRSSDAMTAAQALRSYRRIPIAIEIAARSPVRWR